MRMMNQKQNEDDGEAKHIKRSEDPLKFNMKWSHINNECNDGKDNDLKPLGKGHSSHFLTKYVTKWIQRSEDPKKLTYELSTTNILDKVTLWYLYTCSMIENTIHIHTYAYFSFLFIFSIFIFHFSFFFFFYIYTNVHTLNVNKWVPKR